MKENIIIINEKLIDFYNKNDLFNKCYFECIENNKNKYIIHSAYKIKDKIYSDFDDNKYCNIKYQCFQKCINLNNNK